MDQEETAAEHPVPGQMASVNAGEEGVDPSLNAGREAFGDVSDFGVQPEEGDVPAEQGEAESDPAL